MDSYSAHNKKPQQPNSSGYRHEASSPSDLFSSAQVLADAAMSTFRHESTKVNKAEAATAADKLLHAASQYGHLEEKSFGKYIGKAEEYLHQYAAPSSQSSSHGSAPVKKHQEEYYEDEEKVEQHQSTGYKPSYGGGKVKKHQEQEEEYYDDEEEYTKHKTSARPNSYTSGKTKKHGEEEEEEEGSGGGIGDYMKLAQGILKNQGGGHSGNSAGGQSEEMGVGDYMKMAQGFLGKR